MLRRIAVAYNLGSSDYEPLMDGATILVNDWDKFLVDLEEAVKIPPTENQVKVYAGQEQKKEIEAATGNFRASIRRLKKAMGSL